MLSGDTKKKDSTFVLKNHGDTWRYDGDMWNCSRRRRHTVLIIYDYSRRHVSSYSNIVWVVVCLVRIQVGRSR